MIHFIALEDTGLTMYNSLIETQAAHRHLDDGDWAFVDCQYDLADKNAGYRSYLASHIPGAVYASLHEDLSSRQPVTDCGRHPVPSAEAMGKTFSALGIAGHKQVVAYDNSGGVFAARLWWLLNYAGHNRVAVLDGGLGAWEQAGYKTEKSESRAVAESFRATLDNRALVRLEEVEAVPRLIDSREPDRYAGKTEPLDTVAGHIPGAVNHYWKSNLDDRGKFLAPDRLREVFRELYQGTRAEDVAFYCGSGVSACHNLLAAVHAGFPLPGLYAGSWSEWCADPARAIAVGIEPGE